MSISSDISCAPNLEANAAAARSAKFEELSYKGRHYTLRELIPDGLHLGTVASEYLADQMIEILNLQASESLRDPSSLLGFKGLAE